VLAGDFNIDSFDELSPFSFANIANFSGRDYSTFKTERPSRKIDNIITSPDIEISSVFMSESEYSDHNMLVADLKLDL